MGALGKQFYVTTQGGRRFRRYVVVQASTITTPRRSVTFQYDVVARRFTRRGANKAMGKISDKAGRW